MHARRLFLAAAALAAGAAPALAAGTTERVSVSSHGVQGNGDSTGPAFSADGHVVAFVSDAKNLAPGDTNGKHCRPSFLCGFDVFARDLTTGATDRVSVSSAGVQGNDISFSPAVSTDGRFVAFRSFASNLVAGDTNATDDVFVRDRQNGTTERVSVSSTGVQGNGPSFHPAISRDGRFVAFASITSTLVPGDSNGSEDVFVRDRQAGTTELASVSSLGAQGSGDSFAPAISRDGRFVAFASAATGLVPGDTNHKGDVLVRDRQAGTTVRVSVSSAGAQANGDSGVSRGDPGVALSADGQAVAFASDASNLVQGDTNGKIDIFVHAH